jgi:hypothetical protein
MATDSSPFPTTDLRGRGEVWMNEQRIATVDYELQQSPPTADDPVAGHWRTPGGRDLWGALTVVEPDVDAVFRYLRGYPTAALRLEDGREHLFSVNSLVGREIQLEGIGDWLLPGPPPA